MKRSLADQKAQSQLDKPLSFRQFIERVNPKYQFYPHIEKLIAVLQRVADDELKRVMVYMPPRHGKSECVSRLFTAYYAYRHGERWVGLASYGAGLAYTLSRNARENYREAGGQFLTEGVEHWTTDKGGGMWAAGVGGPATGKGFHLGVVDDPLKDAEEAQSQTIRQKHTEWWQSTFYTRQEPNAAIIVIQTRWHEADLGGWLLSQEKSDDESPENWHIVCMEAIKSDVPLDFPDTCTVEPDEREQGEALCPMRYAVSDLLKIKDRVGSYYWSALYAQNPKPDEGNIFKRQDWRYWKPAGVNLPPVSIRLADYTLLEIEAVDLPVRFDMMAQTWDMAFKDTKTSDFVAGQVWGRVGANKYLLDYVKERADISSTLKLVEGFTHKWPQTITKLVEDKANGPAVIQLLSGKIAGLIAVDPQGGKVSRAYAAQPEVESHNVYLPHPALYSWVNEFVDNCSGFPNIAHDDDVDAFTQMIIRWQVPVVAVAPIQAKTKVR